VDLLVIHSPYDLRRSVGYFPARLHRSRETSIRRSLLRSPSRVSRRHGTPAEPQPYGIPPGVSLPTAHADLRATRRVCLTRLDKPPRGFSPPGAACFPHILPGLISCRSAHGIHPSGLWSPGTVPNLFPGRFLSRRYGNPSLPSLLRRRRKSGESFGLKALFTARVRTRPTARKQPCGPRPSWVLTSLGCSPPATSGTEVPNSHALALSCSPRRGPGSPR
jgi:hypothetical protein